MLNGFPPIDSFSMIEDLFLLLNLRERIIKYQAMFINFWLEGLITYHIKGKRLIFASRLEVHCNTEGTYLQM